MAESKPKGLCGIARVGEKGQIVIPKEFRKMFDINAGDTLVMLGDVKKGIALIKAETFSGVADDIINGGDKGEDNG